MQVPSYQEMVERYDIAILRTPSDLQVTADGDIAVHDGDLNIDTRSVNSHQAFKQFIAQPSSL
jgi:hypothetical protein